MRQGRLQSLKGDDFHELARSRGYVRAKNLDRLARRRGYVKARDFAKVAKSRGYVKEIGHEDVLGAQSFSVDEVIDVGVYAGTEWLYDTFRSADFVLVEPIPDGEALLEHKPEKYTYVNCGLGATAGRLTLNRYHNHRLDSFLDLRHLRQDVPVNRQLAERVEVPVRTLDDVIEEHCTSDNIGIKIDTEGFELEVIRGLEKHKERVTFIIAESSVVRRHLDTYQFSDLVAELRAKNFYFLNVMNPVRTTVSFYDTIFVQKEDPRLEIPIHRVDDVEAMDRAAREQVLSRRHSS